jgi:uncharacterized protein YbjT (DUF2867 family)
MRLVTVFGASGFVGRYVVQRLAQRGLRVRAAVRRPALAEFLRPYGDVGQIAPLQANVRDDASVANAVRGADAVVNLVGVLYETGRQRFDAVHAAGAARIARAAKAAGIGRLVHISAIGADADSASDYARTKAQGEAAVTSEFGPAAKIIRPSIVFGPEDGFYNRFANLARFLPALPLIGGGETRFQPVYVRDVAAAVLAVLEGAPDAIGAPVHELGGPRVYSFRQVLEYILEVTERKRLLVPLPFELARLEAAVLELLPKPLLTRDQVELLKRDNVVSPGMPGLKELGIEATAVEAIVPTYLRRYRKGSAAVGLERHS